MKKFLLSLVALIALAAPLAVAAPAQASPTSQAIGTAKDYLRYMPFSKAGLIDQLQYEGFSRHVSIYAVNHVRVSWRHQAVRSAREYLQSMHFSCSGLIQQLDSPYGEDFTHRQAVYGAHHTSAC